MPESKNITIPKINKCKSKYLYEKKAKKKGGIRCDYFSIEIPFYFNYHLFVLFLFLSFFLKKKHLKQVSSLFFLTLHYYIFHSSITTISNIISLLIHNTKTVKRLPKRKNKNNY